MDRLPAVRHFMKKRCQNINQGPIEMDPINIDILSYAECISSDHIMSQVVYADLFKRNHRHRYRLILEKCDIEKIDPPIKFRMIISFLWLR